MESRNILYISYYFPPMGLSGVQRTAKFVKYLPEYNWKPHVLTTTADSFYAYDESLMDNFAGRDIEIYRTQPKASKKRKVRKLPSYFIQKIGRFVLNFLYQPDSKIKWKKSALQLGRELIRENKIEVIVATAPPFTGFLIARELSKEFNIPFVVDYRDSWVDNPFHYYPTPFHKKYSMKLEEDILKHARHIVVITRQAKVSLLQRFRYLSHQDISIIPHGYDADDFKEFSDVKPDPKKLTITHSGVFQDNRTPKYFLKAVAELIKQDKTLANILELRFIGIMRKGHAKLIKKYGLTANVQMTGYLNHTDSIRNLMESDILWLMLNDTHRTPGKLYEYFGARKPILICSPDGSMRKTALESGAAIATDPKDVKQIADALSTFVMMWKNNTLPVPNEKFVNSFDRKILTSELSRTIGLSLEV